MRRRVVELTSADVDRLPERCRTCTFWELGGPRPIERRGEDAEERIRKSAAWRALELGERPGTGGGCVPGRMITVEGEVAAWCMLGPPGAFARRRPPLPVISDDALLLATLWVEPAFRGAGLGRLLVHAAAKEALRRDRRGIEAYGDRRPREGGCLIPGTWLLHEGFAVEREHPRYPLLRLDVRSLSRLLEPLEQAVEHVRERLALRPETAPQRSGGQLA